MVAPALPLSSRIPVSLPPAVTPFMATPRYERLTTQPAALSLVFVTVKVAAHALLVSSAAEKQTRTSLTAKLLRDMKTLSFRGPVGRTAFILTSLYGPPEMIVARKAVRRPPSLPPRVMPITGRP